MAQGQVYITVGPELEQAWKEWLDANNYGATRVFLAGWWLVSRMSHEERMKAFSASENWARAGPAGATRDGGRGQEAG